MTPRSGLDRLDPAAETGCMTPLWPHQKQALAFANGKPAVMLAMAMRTGKSRVTVELLSHRHAQRVLVLCPKSAINVWPDQFQRYSNGTEYPVLTLKDMPMKQRLACAQDFLGRKGRGVVVINHDAIWRKPFADWALAQHWDALVADESHRLKSPSGVASRFVAKLGQNIETRLGLTGTPFHHTPLDIYGQYRILDRRIFGTNYNNFKHRYGVWVPMGYTGVEILRGLQNEDELYQKFYSIAFRVGPEVLNIPEPLHMTRTCDLSPAGKRVYRDLEKDFYAQVDAGEITVANAMVKGLRLQQATSGFGKVETGEEVQIDTAKQELLADLLEDTDEPVVVFCRFRHDLDVVHTVAHSLKKASLELSGRVDNLAAWQAGEAPILAVQIQAGGAGVDLSRAKIAVYYSLGLSLGDHEQSQARMQAKDQTHTIAYYYLLADGTVDRKVYNALQSRKDVIQALLNRGGA